MLNQLIFILFFSSPFPWNLLSTHNEVFGLFDYDLDLTIKEKESTLTSVKPTVDAINTILARFGFEGFILIENPDEKAKYKIVRSDGRNVERTLSEGEYNFICFLYF